MSKRKKEGRGTHAVVCGVWYMWCCGVVVLIILTIHANKNRYHPVLLSFFLSPTVVLQVPGGAR